MKLTIPSLLLACAGLYADGLDLSKAVVVVRPGTLPSAEKTAARVLVEELKKRTGLTLTTSTAFPEGQPAIAITASASVPAWGRKIPQAETRAEGYRLYVEGAAVWVLGADARGALFGVGDLLRKLDWAPRQLHLPTPLDISAAPAYPIRGHQLGYRPQANSYDAWDVAQFEQYIRELTFFGVNSIEGIPFQDDRESPVMKVPRRDMNLALGDICDRYGLDYWVWVPADFDLNDKVLRARMLDRFERFSGETKALTGFFFPGGDPGSNPPELVLPFLEDIAKRMRPAHPHAKIWISLQWFNPTQVDTIYKYINEQHPDWLAGLVAGPSSPPVSQTRERLAKQYQLRLYPDLTHNKLCQYPVPSWDQAYALTLGREAINPRPAEFAAIHNRVAPQSDGFISYSDGVHDDVNKVVWSALSWDPGRSVRDILIDYARIYFEPGVAEEAADGILALEKNWRGPLIDNGAVEGTLQMWEKLEKRAPHLETNWRWQMCLLRANYDAYTRRRLINETKLELQANALMAQAGTLGAEKSMTEALFVLNRVRTHPVNPELRARCVELCGKLFHSIGLQTSVEKYYASGAERGAVLDFIDYPLNNRWWLEDEFSKIRAMHSEEQQTRRLLTLATWEHPGAGSFYDNTGNMAKSPHVMPTQTGERQPEPTFWWWDQGQSRARLSWQITMWPASIVYEALDPAATYVVRSTGSGQALLRINGERVTPAIDGKLMGEFKEFPVASKYLKDGKLVLTWDRPTNERELNWRQRSRLSEVWLLKQAPGSNAPRTQGLAAK